VSTAVATPAPREDWRLRIGVPFGTMLLRLLALTWRVEVRGESGWRARRAQGQGTVLTLWHGHLLPLTHYLRNLGMLVLVSEHRDGEIIARILQRLGYGLIRGSSTRGGARAFAEMVRALKGGATIAITPDGPRGPARKFSPGAAVAAQRAGVPITTMFVTASRAWTLRSWDSFMIPKPFAKLVLHFSDPTFVKGTTPAEAGEDTARFEALTGPREVIARG
jgi:lysophospholipid acyltransferase (LPLAT)-like uncharacterized protein